MQVFKTYCWIHGTFTLPSQLTGGAYSTLLTLLSSHWHFPLRWRVFMEPWSLVALNYACNPQAGRAGTTPTLASAPTPGPTIGHLLALISLSTLLPSTFDRDLVSVTEEGDEVRHAWYQWVVFVLFFQVPPSAIS